MNTINIALDAMGGDFGIPINIKGALLAINAYNDLVINLIGEADKINKELLCHNYNKSKIIVTDAKEIITNDDVPTVAIRKKKDSSMVVGFNLLKENACSGFVSSGSTGALLVGSTFIVGRIDNILRPALGTVLPNRKGFSFLIDAGANVDSKPEFLLQFAIMGSAYMETIMGIQNPKVGLVNIGTEKDKGNALTKEAYNLLEASKLNFVGNIEARDIPEGIVDVMVCDAFVGNVILKYTEGLSMSLLGMIKDSLMKKPLYKLGALISKGAFVDLKKELSYEKIGGAPFLGLKSLVVKAHGNSNEIAIKSAIGQCYKASKNNLVSKIAQNVNK